MPEPASPDVEAIAAARDTALRDVERTMIQIVQTSISMIGFGFTIHAFLLNADARAALGVDLDQVARRIGLAMLTLGLLNLAWGLWSQSRFLAVVRRRHQPPPGSVAPPGSRARSTGVVAGLLAPLVMHSAAQLATASLALMLVGLVSWVYLHHRWPEIGSETQTS